MYRLRMESCLLLGTALLAGCSDRNTATAPSARPLAATAALVDRPFTWTFTCNDKSYGNGLPWASWSLNYSFAWTENTVVISGTQKSYGHYCSAGRFTGTGVRPGTANGFTACVESTCQSWSFDPAGSFSAKLTGSDYLTHCSKGTCSGLIPNSAVACIWFVRIWTSRGLPSGPITVVCRDWYMLNLGIAT